jgi:hypothetical protein
MLHRQSAEFNKGHEFSRPAKFTESLTAGSLALQNLPEDTGVSRRFSENDQGQNCLPDVRRQPVPCSDDALQIDAKGCQDRTIEAPVLQRICSAALRAIGANTIAVSGCVGIEVGFDSHQCL